MTTQQTESARADEPKTFTQEEVNALMGRTRAEERSKFADYDQLKQRAGVADKLENASRTDKEKLERSAADWQRKAVDAEARVADTAIRAEIRVKAAKLGIIDPDAAVALVDRSAVGYSDKDGVKGVSEALELLIAAKPYLKGGGGGTAPKPGAPNLNAQGGKPAPGAPQLTPEQRNVAHRLFPELPHTDAEVKYNKGLPIRA